MPRRRWRTGRLTRIVVVLGLLAPLGVTVNAPAGYAAAATGCGYGTGGYWASGLCWLNLSGYNDTTARSAAGQNFSLALPGGYTMTFNAKTTTPSGYGSVVGAAVPLPTYSGAYLGARGYVGTPGAPALYGHTASAKVGLTTTLSGITVTSPAGAPVTGFSMVAADAESTDPGETLTLSSNVNLTQLNPSVPVCGGGLSGVGTTTVTCLGSSATSGNATAQGAVGGGAGRGLAGRGGWTADVLRAWAWCGANVIVPAQVSASGSGARNGGNDPGRDRE